MSSHVFEINNQMVYCSLCDIYFSTPEDRATHVQECDKHPSCDKCVRRFPNKEILRNHLTLSPFHNYCSSCKIDFRTAGGLRAHVEFSPLHSIVSANSDEDSDDDHSDEEDSSGWEDDLGPYFFPEEEIFASLRRGDLTIYHEECDDADDAADKKGNDANDEDACDSAIDQVDIFDDKFAILECDACDYEHPLEPSSNCPSSNYDSINSSKTEHAVSKSKQSRPAYTCPLCLEIPINCMTTQCGHAFCKSCLERSLTMRGICPMCRTPVMPKQLRYIRPVRKAGLVD